MNVILDTNVIVSALLSPSGIPGKILNLVLNGNVNIVYDNNILSEYIDVLGRDYLRINKELVNIVLDFIAKDGEYKIAIPQNKKFKDEDDKIFYDLFKSGAVDYLITGNKKHFPNEKGIVTPREFIDLEYSEKQI
ncbi:MAG: putative toxin-antitoxin system toxin component, PIN family [Treponema sp.]|nr:putative toxin-antitoxin system toxin component, PIN family [Treponema sp.]